MCEFHSALLSVAEKICFQSDIWISLYGICSGQLFIFRKADLIPLPPAITWSSSMHFEEGLNGASLSLAPWIVFISGF